MNTDRNAPRGGWEALPELQATNHRDHARSKSLWVAGIFLALLALVLFALVQVATFDHPTPLPQIVASPLLLISILVIQKARRYGQPSPYEVLKSDRRQPIVLFRRFEADSRVLHSSDNRTYGTALLSGLTPAAPLLLVRSEEGIAKVCKEFGPVIALGAPRDEAPPLGAARVYVSDDRWKIVVEELLSFSQAAVFVVEQNDAGGLREALTPAIEFELEAAGRALSQERIFVVGLQRKWGAVRGDVLRFEGDEVHVVAPDSFWQRGNRWPHESALRRALLSGHSTASPERS